MRGKIQPYSVYSGYTVDSEVCCCSIAQLCATLCDPMDCSTPGFPVLHHLLESIQTRVHGVGDSIRPSHPMLSPSPPAFSLSRSSACGASDSEV